MMIITDLNSTTRNEPKESQDARAGDTLNMRKVNALPTPITAAMCGGGEYWIETLDIQTGLMRLCVMGMPDIFIEFSQVKTLIDADGIEHDPDDFYIED